MQDSIHELSHLLQWGLIALPVIVVCAPIFLYVILRYRKAVPPLPIVRMMARFQYACLAIFCVGFAGMILDGLVSARIKAHDVACMQNEKELVIGLLTYAQDYDETFPPADNWFYGSKRFLTDVDTASVIRCPGSSSPYGYAMNSKLSWRPLSDIGYPADTFLLFESDAKMPNTSGGPNDVTKGPRHGHALNYGFADGHAKYVSSVSTDKYRWDPGSKEGMDAMKF